MNRSQAYIGLDVGGTMLKGLAFDPAGRKLAEETTATGDDGSETWRERARSLWRSVAAHCPKPYRTGVAAPGLAAPDRRSIAFMPGRLPGLEGLDWQRWLQLDSDSPVPVYNDAQAALLGEAWLGAAKGAAHVLLLTLGTGVGGAAMVDGRVLSGRCGRAGHLGHISLDPKGRPDIVKTPGSLEDAIGEHTLAARSEGRFGSTRELVSAVKNGSTEATRIWLASLEALGAALAGLINVLDPELIVIGGGIAEADEVLFQPLQTVLDRFEWRPGGAAVRIVKAVLGPSAGATGAAYGAMLTEQSGDDYDRTH